MIVKEPHRRLKIMELGWVSPANLVVRNITCGDQAVEQVCSDGVLLIAEERSDLRGLQHFVNSALVLARRRVVVVLDAVVAAARDVLRDHGPLVAEALEKTEDHAFFFVADGPLVDLGVQVVVPPFTALFAGAVTRHHLHLQHLGHERPLLRPVLVHQLNDRVVLLHR